MDIDHIFVVGAGVMGSGIAQAAATAGFRVTCMDPQVGQLEKAKESIDKSVSRLLEKGVVSATQRAAAEGIWFTTSLDSAATADFVIEAATEHPDRKAAIFRDIDGRVRPGVVLASNTSSISITRIAAATTRPESVIGMHFMNPVPLMKLVEVIKGLATSDETAAATSAIARAMGKEPVTVNDSPGFVGNRILIPMINEAVFVLQEGIATPESIDAVMKLGMNHPIGPLALADLIGIDVVLSILEVLHRDLGEDRYRPAPLLRRMVDAGHLGRKTCRGFYRY